MDFKYHLEETWKTFTEFLPGLLINTLALIGISFITFGIMAPVCIAGYVQSLLETIRDKRKPEVRDLFSQMDLFLPLLVFTILAGLVIMIGFAILILPGFLVIIALSFFCLYMLPLMTDENMNIIDAFKKSRDMALAEPITEHIVVVALYLGISTLGQSTILGFIFTQPFATLFILSTFQDRMESETRKKLEK